MNDPLSRLEELRKQSEHVARLAGQNEIEQMLTDRETLMRKTLLESSKALAEIRKELEPLLPDLAELE